MNASSQFVSLTIMSSLTSIYLHLYKDRKFYDVVSIWPLILQRYP